MQIVPQHVLRRVRNLMDTANHPDADMQTALGCLTRAADILKPYGVTLEELRDARHLETMVVRRAYRTSHVRHAAYMQRLRGLIGRFTDCKTAQRTNPVEMVFYGMPPDAQLAEFYAESLISQIEWHTLYKKGVAVHTLSYKEGWVDGIGQRMSEVRPFLQGASALKTGVLSEEQISEEKAIVEIKRSAIETFTADVLGKKSAYSVPERSSTTDLSRKFGYHDALKHVDLRAGLSSDRRLRDRG